MTRAQWQTETTPVTLVILIKQVGFVLIAFLFMLTRHLLWEKCGCIMGTVKEPRNLKLKNANGGYLPQETE